MFCPRLGYKNTRKDLACVAQLVEHYHPRHCEVAALILGQGIFPRLWA